MKNGYTLIELIISVSIIAGLLSLGISAYTKSHNKNIATSAAEQIMSILQDNQQKANIGKKDCAGKFLGQRLTFSGSTITAASLCEGGVLGTEIVNTIAGAVFTTSSTIVFNPLSFGVDLSSPTQTISYVSKNGSTHSLELTRSGTIKYLGATSP